MLLDQEPEIQYNPPEENVSEQEKKNVATEAVAIVSEDLESPEESYWDIVNNISSKMDVDKVKQVAVQEDNDKDKAVLDKLILDTSLNGSLSPEAAAGSVLQYQGQKKNVDNTDPASFDRAVARRFTLDDVKAEEQAFSNFATRSVVEMSEKAGLGDKFRAYGGFMLPDRTMDLTQFLGSNDFTVISTFRTFTNKFFKLSPKEKIQVWPEIVERARDKFDNDIDAAVFLSTLLTTDPVREAKIDLAFDLFDVATFGLGGLLFRASKKSGNLVMKTKDLDDPSSSAVIFNKTLTDPTGEMAQAFNMTDAERAATVSPFDMQKFLPGAVDGISPELSELIQTGVVGVRDEVSKVKGALDNWKDGKLLRSEFLSEEAMEQAIEDTAARGLQRQRELGEAAFGTYGVKYENIRIGETSPEGVEVLYDVAGDTMIRKEFFTVDNETGMFHNVKGNPIASKLHSPLQRFGDNSFVVNIATRLQDQSSIISNSLARAHTLAIKPIKWSKESLAKVDDALRTGDDWDIEDGKVFTPRELLEGTAEGRTIPKLNDKEIASYFSLRAVLDEAHDFVNFMEYRKNTIAGLKTVNVRASFRDGTASKEFNAKPMFNIDEALKIFTKVSSQKVQDKRVQTSKFDSPKIYDPELNAGKGGTRRVNKEQLTEAYEQSYRLSKLDDWTELGEDGVEYVLTRNIDISDLPYNQIRKRAGYLPKFYEDANYFVYKINKDGVKLTDRIFDNKIDADSYRANQQGIDDGWNYVTKADRELTTSEWETELTNSYGGPFRGARATHEILFGIEGNVPKRLDAYDSISRNLKYISNIMPINDWRASVQRMWMNTAAKISETEGKNILADSNDFWSEISGLTKHDPKRIGLEDLREYLADQIRIPTRDERMFDSLSRGLAETMEKTFLDSDFTIPLLGKQNLRKSVMNLRHVDPFSMARTATFHPLLGFFNVSQLIVQAQGASIALALDPLSAPRRIAEYTYLRAIVDIGSHDLRAQNTVRKAMAKFAGIPEDEAIEIADQFLKSGLSSSIKLSADMGAALSAGTSSFKALKTIADKGLIFYREGELVTRGYSFLQARAAWKIKNPGKKIDDKDLKSIIDDTYRIMMNMSRANRAEWQKGAFSVPTQFTQVYWKFIGNMTGKKWSKGEKAKVLAMQLAIFGAAGVPGLTYVGNGIANLAGYEPGDIPDGFIDGLASGFEGFVTGLTGIDNDFSSRMAFMGNNDTIVTKLFDAETPMTEAMFGAFGSVFGRTTDAIKKLAPLFANPFMDDSTMDLNSLNTALSGIAKITSTWNNIQKVYAGVQMNRFLSSKGKYVASVGDMNPQTLVFKALGFEADIIADHYKRKEFVTSSKKRRKKVAEEIVSLFHSYLGNLESDNPEELANNFRNMRKVILAMNGFHDEGEDWKIINKMVGEKITQSKDDKTQTTRDYIEEVWRAQDRIPVIGDTTNPLQRLD